MHLIVSNLAGDGVYFARSYLTFEEDPAFIDDQIYVLSVRKKNSESVRVHIRLCKKHIPGLVLVRVECVRSKTPASLLVEAGMILEKRLDSIYRYFGYGSSVGR